MQLLLCEYIYLLLCGHQIRSVSAQGSMWSACNVVHILTATRYKTHQGQNVFTKYKGKLITDMIYQTQQCLQMMT